MYLPGAGSLERAIFLSRANSVLSLGSINGFNIRVGVSRFCSAKQEHFFSIIRCKVHRLERENDERNEIRKNGRGKGKNCLANITLSSDIDFPFFSGENSYDNLKCLLPNGDVGIWYYKYLADLIFSNFSYYTWKTVVASDVNMTLIDISKFMIVKYIHFCIELFVLFLQVGQYCALREQFAHVCIWKNINEKRHRRKLRFLYAADRTRAITRCNRRKTSIRETKE